MKCTALLLTLSLYLARAASALDPSPVTLRIRVPATVRVGVPFSATFEVTNVSRQGLYFKQPWKWAPNGLRLVAVGPNGATIETAPRLYDIPRENVCQHIRRIPPGHTIQFKATLNAPGVFTPSLPLTEPGQYELSWVYEVAHYEEELRCASRGWPIFSSRAQSEPVQVRVTP
jgi:hypothetical protein